MKKSERLNDMLIYLNNKKSFNLKNIMERYSVSKSTALRDVQSLEGIGMPIYTKPGRNGYYGILSNRLLSPIIFSVDELSALYFSMHTLSAYQSTPFHLSVEKLRQKFEACISSERTKAMHKMGLVFNFSPYQSKNECPLLKDILQMAVTENSCEIYYLKDGEEKKYYLQFFNISSIYGQWYASAYNFQSEKAQVFRCDKIKSVLQSNKYSAKPISQFLNTKNIFRTTKAVEFEVDIHPKGADIFYKESYPSMEIHNINGRCYISGFYNKGEENFIAGYFMMYGELINSISPSKLKDLIVKKLEAVKKHLSAI